MAELQSNEVSFERYKEKKNETKRVMHVSRVSVDERWAGRRLKTSMRIR